MNFQGERVQALGQQDASGWKGIRQRLVFGYSYASNHPCLIITFRSHKVGASDPLGLPHGCEPWQPWLWVTWFWWKLPDPFGSAMNLMIWDGILVLACFSIRVPDVLDVPGGSDISATFFFWCKGWHRATWQRSIMFHRVWSLDVTCSTESQFQPITNDIFPTST